MAKNHLPLFPVTVVGSWPRPEYLMDALRKRQRGQISDKEFNEIADQGVLEALLWQEEAGVDIVSDGEQRRDNFYSFVADKLEGVELVTMAALMDMVEDKSGFEQILREKDVPAFAIKNATVMDKIRPKAPLALDEYEFLHQRTDKPIKVPLPGPYQLMRSMWVDGVSDRAYSSREELALDLVEILRNELIALRDAGAAFVQFDEPTLTDVVFSPEVKERSFMCGSMSSTSGNPTRELLLVTRMLKSIVEGVDGIRVGVHVCRGNWSRKEDVLLKGDYEPLVPTMMGMGVDQLVLEFATPRAGELEVFEHYPQAIEMGLGVSNPRSDTVESPEFIVNKVNEALQFFKPDQIFLNPDCGFGTFADRPLNTAEVAAQKLHSMSEAAQQLRATYG
ncbi:MAG: cobalamin-independent methionine synthase II family protein [Chloroflexi bacterium]|nr:cobalamin-independent methionine synthase II family protein [Chloroflexota bacterium]MCI0581268.1 cobalamin-independent methionine synthase II family protein [Chloroflexota bacterium]MCI0648335.1 cobalamin-independent methionine synthase II family protein [Chloroflexota bacterium]MCI0730137.1 cobalamin-independent methionine synthase II family protein [Chloroflexota bacterium]